MSQAEEKKTTYRGDLTQGPIIPKMLRFSVPMILGNLVFQFYNLADSLIVSNTYGTNGLAAVSASFPIMMLFNAMFMGLATGAGIIISQFYGAKDQENLQKAVDTSFTLCLIVGAAITLIGLTLSTPLLRLLQTPGEIISDSSAYLRIIYAGFLFNMVYNMGAGILRGMGDSKWPLVFLCISAGLNVILDIVLVAFLHMGVIGAALATITCQLISAILTLTRMVKGGYPVQVRLHKFLMDKFHVQSIIRLGLPTALQNVAVSLGAVVIQSFSNSFGADFIAGNAIVMKVDGFAVLPMMGYSMALSTFVGQNIGAGQVERARKGINYSMWIIIGFGLVLGVILWFFAKYLMLAFGAEPHVLELGINGIRILAFFYLFMGLNQSFSGALRGAGAAVMPMISSLVGAFVRIPIAYFMAVQPRWQYGLFWSMVISNIISFLIVYVYFQSGKWRKNAIVVTNAKIDE